MVENCRCGLVIGGGAALTFILTKNNLQEKSSSEIAQTVTTPAVSPATKDTTALLSVTEPGQTTLAPAVEKAKSANGTTAQANTQTSSNDFTLQQDKAPVQDSIKSSLDEIAVADIQKPSVSPRVAPASAAGNNAVKADEKNDYIR